jgi:hypothetical protein
MQYINCIEYISSERLFYGLYIRNISTFHLCSSRKEVQTISHNLTLCKFVLVNAGNFLVSCENWSASQEGLCSME